MPIVGLAVLTVYVIYHIVMLVSPGFETALARRSDDVISMNIGGYVFRDEAVIFPDSEANFAPVVGEGERVAAGKTVAVGTDENGNEVYAVSNSAGFYHKNADGYEYSFTSEAALGITYQNYASTVSVKKQYVGGSAGKIATGFVWYLACLEPSAERLSEGTSYDVSFGDVSVGMTLVTLDNGEDGVVLVFESADIPSGLCFERYKTGVLTVPVRNAAYVPTKAIYESDGAYCVYTFENGFARRHEVELIFNRGDETVISCNEKIDDSFVVIGKGLYDGKAIH